MSRRVLFCGALQGTVSVRSGETVDQALERAEQRINDLLDGHAKRLNAAFGLDFGDSGESEEEES